MSIKKMNALLLAGVLCLSALTGCGAKPEDTVATLGEETVTYELANFLCKYQKSTVDDMYAIYGMTWDTDLYGSGVTMEEEFKDSAMDLLHDLYTLKAHMADYGVEVTAEDEAAITAAAGVRASKSARRLRRSGIYEGLPIAFQRESCILYHGCAHTTRCNIPLGG